MDKRFVRIVGMVVAGIMVLSLVAGIVSMFLI